MVSQLRVVTEHAHGGIKRLRMVADMLRLRGEWRRDTVMVVACGPHNLRVRGPHRAYLQARAREALESIRIRSNLRKNTYIPQLVPIPFFNE